MLYWKKFSKQKRSKRIKDAVNNNVNFSKDTSLGYPSSKLDNRAFYNDTPFLKDAPKLQAYVVNPNNIGYHTFDTSKKAFATTQDIERKVLNVIAVDILKRLPMALTDVFRWEERKLISKHSVFIEIIFLII
jgi:tyrosine decarboxylase/aspartate 1-decarboxylase